jgi:hypothetical protein
MSEEHLIAAARDPGIPGDYLADRRHSVLLRVEGWLRRADFILAKTQFDTAAALALVQQIRDQTGPGDLSLSLAAGQALGSLQIANRRTTNYAASTVAKQRFGLVRNAVADQACRMSRCWQSVP